MYPSPLRRVFAGIFLIVFLISSSHSDLVVLASDELPSGSGVIIEPIDSATASGNISSEEILSPLSESSGGLTEFALSDTGVLDTGTGSTESGIVLLPEYTGSGDVLPSPEESVPPSDSPIIEAFIDGDIRNEQLGYVDGEVLVKFREDVMDLSTDLGADTLTMMTQVLQVQSVEMLEQENTVLLTSDTKYSSLERIFGITERSTTDELMDKLQDDPRVESVQPNFIYYPSSLPDDPSFSSQWNLYNTLSTGSIRADIHYTEAMDFMKSTSLQATPTIIAVLDMGVAYDHPDLKNMMWDGSNCVTDTGAYLGGCMHGYDIVDADKDPHPSYGANDSHGTHVAGIIGAETNNGIGMTGIAPKVQIMSIRIMGNNEKPYTTTRMIIDAIGFAQANGAKVINASYGSIRVPTSYGLFDSITYSKIKGFSGLFIAAAGNNSLDTDTQYFYPSGFGMSITLPVSSTGTGMITIPGLDNVISVGATDASDKRASFSNYGKNSVDIAAPGVSILSTIATRITLTQETLLGSMNWKKGEGDLDAQTWTGKLDATGNILQINGAPVIWGDARPVYAKNTNSSYEGRISNTKNLASITATVDIWCDTPMNQFPEVPKDALVIEYSRNGKDYLSGGILERNTYLGIDTVIEGHTGKLGSRTITLESMSDSDMILRFRWVTDAIDDTNKGIANFGCALGKIRFNGLDNGQANNYARFSGTSMAAPHVVGAAALAWSYFPGATYSEIKLAILEGGDTLTSLSGLTKNAKRLNLKGMLQILTGGSQISALQAIPLSDEDIRVQLDTDSSTTITLTYVDSRETLGKHPYLFAATLLTDIGVIPAPTEMGYQLDGFLSRSDFSIMLGKSLQVVPGNCTGKEYFDVNSTLGIACGYIESLIASGVIQKEFLFFSPTANITRIEAMRLIARSLKYAPTNSIPHFLDTMDLGNEINGYINIAYDHGCTQKNSVLDPLSTLTRGEIYQLMTCIRGMFRGNPSGRVLDGAGYHHNILLSGLAPDREYFYTIVSGKDQFHMGVDPVYSIFLPRILSSTVTGSLVAHRNIFFSGATSTGIIFSSGSSLGSILLMDSGATASIRLPFDHLQIQNTGNWDGTLWAPTRIGNNQNITVSGSIQSALVLYTLGGSGTSLSLIGNKATVILPLDASMNGKLIDVTRSESISTGFTVIANCSVQNGSCQFQTDHFSYFALVPSASVPIIDTIAPIITLSGATQLSVIIGSGFIDPGATCTDNIDTTCRVTVTGSVNTSQTGSYILTYTARDLANNIATPLLRTVQVVSNSSGENIPTPTPAPTPTPSPVMPVSGVMSGPGGGGGGGGGNIFSPQAMRAIGVSTPLKEIPMTYSHHQDQKNVVDVLIASMVEPFIQRVMLNPSPEIRGLYLRSALRKLDDRIGSVTFPRIRTVLIGARDELQYILRGMNM